MWQVAGPAPPTTLWRQPVGVPPTNRVTRSARSSPVCGRTQEGRRGAERTAEHARDTRSWGPPCWALIYQNCTDVFASLPLHPSSRVRHTHPSADTGLLSTVI